MSSNDHKEYSKQETSKQTREKRMKFAKRGGLYITNQMSDSISSMIQERPFNSSQTKNSKAKGKDKSGDNIDWETETLLHQTNNRRNMKLNISNARQSKMDIKKKFLGSQPDGLNIDEKTKRYIRNNFEERIQNEIVLKAFIDGLVIKKRYLDISFQNVYLANFDFWKQEFNYRNEQLELNQHMRQAETQMNNTQLIKTICVNYIQVNVTRLCTIRKKQRLQRKSTFLVRKKMIRDTKKLIF
jgi:hypothetical protein